MCNVSKTLEARMEAWFGGGESHKRPVGLERDHWPAAANHGRSLSRSLKLLAPAFNRLATCIPKNPRYCEHVAADGRRKEN